MNDYLLAVVLGVVEGLTEFLPISSTAHLRIVQHFLGVSLSDEYWKFFAVFIQLGAILAVLLLYWRRFLGFLGNRPALFGPPLLWLKHPFGLLAIAFLCTAIPAVLAKKLISHNLESLTIMAWALLVGGIVMLAVDFFCKKPTVTSIDQMKPWQAAVIGLLQLLSALFPGTSRSMSTTAAGQILGLSRPGALEFSFLLSVPIMLAACFFDMREYFKENAVDSFSLHQGLVLAVGFLVSFVVAYVVVAWFLKYVQKHGFWPFAIYRIAVGGLLLFFLT
jgi:undecaprenyl-diphosphatase